VVIKVSEETPASISKNMQITATVHNPSISRIVNPLKQISRSLCSWFIGTDETVTNIGI